MNRLNYKNFALLIIALLFLIWVEFFASQPIDFSLDFRKKHDIPYGCSALNSLLPEFMNSEIPINNESFYSIDLNAKKEKKTYLIITDNFNPDKLDAHKILKMANDGNIFFIAAVWFSKEFLDTLNLEFEYSVNIKITNENKTSTISIIHPEGKIDTFYLKRNNNRSKFIIDNSNAEAIGFNNNDNPNFISCEVGKGKLILSCEPMIYTNYHILDSNNYKYTETAFNYLSDNQLVWDEYYKPGNNILGSSPMRYILETDSLRASWYLLLIALFINVFFNSRRMQRVIPIIEPKKNTSLEFTKTLGRLYYQNRNHIELANKKMQHFHVYVHQKYNLSMEINSEDHLSSLVLKSGLTQSEITNIYKTYQWIMSQTKISHIELDRFVALINKFYKNCN